ncbi:hypothetical protein KC331_g1362 [Hortaea werneckii]|uniref:Ribosomal RNA-processing protein 42 n=1 Tax=Hortaea werneckii TaxID=91943 RepID=A0A3M7CBN7_HORWE|nr:hypothetical protein KC331_g1362 [Hortaea werneckii]KAI7722089.1 hypothetical protein KC353_g804 [Hortaea werneckii]RMY49521.1 hypothetical protein D0865_07438 [Hortaea werneckii]
MAPYTNIPLSPAELSYLHTSLTQSPPIRPDGRSPTQFRPLIAESDILPSANGSARICFADGTEAIVGVKAEVEKTRSVIPSYSGNDASGEEHSQGVLGLGKGSGRDVDDEDRMDADGGGSEGKGGKGRDEWVEVAIDVPGMRDDDALPVFLSAMLTEALLADGGLKDRLWINRRFHWRLYIDILLLSQPLSYPLPLLSLTTHLALLSTRLPALVSERDEDPLFNDDWEASTFLYPKTSPSTTSTSSSSTAPPPPPPITLLVVSVSSSAAGDAGQQQSTTILFDPSREELAVADAVVAISLGVISSHQQQHSTIPASSSSSSTSSEEPKLALLALRTIDPPSRLTAAGVPDRLNTTTPSSSATPAPSTARSGTGANGGEVSGQDVAAALKEKVRGGGATGTAGGAAVDGKDTVWYPPRGGVKRGALGRMVRLCIEGDGGTTKGVGWEVLEGLAAVGRDGGR